MLPHFWGGCCSFVLFETVSHYVGPVTLEITEINLLGLMVCATIPSVFSILIKAIYPQQMLAEHLFGRECFCVVTHCYRHTSAAVGVYTSNFLCHP